MEKKNFYRMLLVIGLPVALQNLISTSVNLMDTLMVGTLGEKALSATSFANQIFFFYSIIIFGIASGAVVLCSQYWGKKDGVAIQKILTLSFKIASMAGLFFMLLLWFIPEQLMGFFTQDGEVIAQGVAYLRIVSFAYMLYGLTTTYLMVLRSVEDVKIAMYIYSISVVVNIFFNYMFIFGKFGAPAMGVAGAAVGTLIARCLEFLIMSTYMLRFEKAIAYRLPMLTWHEPLLLKDLLHYGMPIMINELLWGLAHTLHVVVLGHMSIEAVAANSICSVVFQMSMSFIIGMSSASAVVIGKSAGAGQREETLQYARWLLPVYAVLGLLLAMLIVLLRTPVMFFYQQKFAADTLLMAQQFMLVYALVIFCTAFCHPMITGILRGGGDIGFSSCVDVGCLWLFLPLGALAAFGGWSGPVMVYFIFRLEIVLKSVLCLWRLRNDQWLRTVTRDFPAVEI